MTKRMSNRAAPLPPNDVLYAAALEYFEYRNDGNIYYKRDPRHKDCKISKFIGKRAGGDDGHGYLMCMLLGLKFKVHQVVWILHNKEFPAKPIDHINRNRRDNRIENLRLAEDLENMQNIVSATMPYAGVSKSPRSGRFVARVTYRGKKHYLGYHDTPEQANAVYVEAKKRLSADFSPV